MWIERVGYKYNEWIYKVEGYEVGLINFIDWSGLYEVIVRGKGFKENKILYISDFEVARFKCLLVAKDLGWVIKDMI